MPKFKRMQDLELTGRRLLIREDLNVPVREGMVASDARIRAALPTLRMALERGAEIIVLSHLGRPQEGQFDPAFSLAPVAVRLGELLGQTVPLLPGIEAAATAAGPIALLENTRFLKGEAANDDALAERLASLADIFVMDAFAVAHRAQASTEGVARHASLACAGPLLAHELEALAKALEKPARPLVAIVGGAKVSTKLNVLDSLTALADCIIVGGGIANTFAAAAGLPIGASLHEAGLKANALQVADKVEVPVPVDWMVGKRPGPDERAVLRLADQVADDEAILDIGPETARRFKARLADAGTILWNGPVGVFEFDQFGEGTRHIAEGIAESNAFSIAGGGDTLAAIEKYGVRDGISCISTGGGAFLEFVEGKSLPGVAVLEAL
ncbi:MAG: phosphoglycerate kinase [Gammaproteobacteria bacterium]|nr:phosphoglycerate kinase [Gammaproteobacteria bacterium]MDE0270726.1 phosphoglycerate kinase [Gammaproteobacteria bacterium]